MEIIGFHTQAHNRGILSMAKLATGPEQWLGDGYYFWQDEEFSEWWGDNLKCKAWNRTRKYDMYKSVLKFDADDFIDTVFNEIDYYQFMKTIEKFSKKFSNKFKKKPTLIEFNDFIADHGIWDEIKIIRFQDLPPNDNFVTITGFYYKKRIQIRVNDVKIISTFDHLITKDCVN